MAPYEPKTDSKEFEVLNTGQGSMPGADAVADSADITIRLWQQDRPASAGSMTWRTESVLVYMIADLATASRGRVDDSTPAMTAHFDSSAQALVAAKRIQTSILEFLACRPGDSLAAAILVHPSATTSGGFNAAMAQGALRLAEPGQILLSQEISRRLHDLPGIELRSVPALTTGGTEQAGLSELIWISPDRIVRMQASTGDRSRRDDSPPMGATMIVNAPFGNSRQGTRETPQSVIGTTGSIAQVKTVTTRSQKVSSDRASVSNDLATGRDSAIPQGPDELEAPSFLTRTRLILGLVAVVLVGAIVWEFMPHNVAKPKLHVQENQPGGETTGGQTSQTGQSGQTSQTGQTSQIDASGSAQSTVDQKVDDAHPKTTDAANTSVTTGKSTRDKRSKDKARDKGKQNEQNTEEKPVEAVVIPGYEGLTQKDIPNLLQMARNHAGNGNYERARTEYRAILQLQPSNADAKEGLRKLDVAQSNR